MARDVKRSLCAGEGIGRAAPTGQHAARAQCVGRLGNNKEISAQRAGGGKQHCLGRIGLCTGQDPVGSEDLRHPPHWEQWDHRQLPGGMWE